MTSYLYVGDDARVFPAYSLEVKPGDLVYLDNVPDDDEVFARYFDKVDGPDNGQGVPNAAVAAQVTEDPPATDPAEPEAPAEPAADGAAVSETQE